MEFYIPQETGEFLAFSAAVTTAFLGLVIFLAPGLSFRLLGLAQREGGRAALAEGRSTIGGFHLGVGLAAILLAQPMVYLALGSAFALAFFGRILSMMSDGSGGLANWLLLLLQGALAAFPLGYAFGFI